MTTRPSSSPRSSPTRPKTLFDAISQPVDLGDEVGRGGEGSVYEVQGNSSLVAKVYHKLPLPEDQVAKLRSMSAVWSAGLEKISAWPRTILFDPVHRQPCGLLMSKMEGARPLHELYGTANRRRHYPDAGWHHLVLAARNAAAAFNTLHGAGIIVGDVNQGNLLVDSKMCVRMIDCDSFQITREGKTFNCPVGSPHFTPPELQGQRLRDVVRTVNHDRFGLAVLIFHLLFVGRHPFAGRFRGQGDLTIERAIAECRFAFSPNKAETQVDPPPASLLLEDLPKSIGALFEAAFRPKVMRGHFRPSPEQWIQELDLLIKRRKACNIDPMHVYAPEANRCPWCWIEDIGGPSFFVPGDVPSTVTSLRQARLDETVMNLPEVAFPNLPAERIGLPTLPKLKAVKPRPKLTSLDWAAGSLVASLVATLVGAFVSPVALAAGAGLSLACAGYLAASKSGRERRASTDGFLAKLGKQWNALKAKARKIDIAHRTRLAGFDPPAQELVQERKDYNAQGDDLVKVIVASRHSQLDEYLRNVSIRDNVEMISGLTLSHVTLLESFGVESAYDAERMKLYGIPTIDEAMSINLVQWRAEMERRFRFNPEHGITLDNLKSIGDATVRRFKMMQARKIMMSNERLKMLADAGKNELVASLSSFDADMKQWKAAAAEYAEFQQSRRPLERLINRSYLTILGPTAGVILLALLFNWAKQM
jgi:DNA-binding helix-hairpin-helix protein with protein kinase domain